jgi:methionyl-tRNA synthetase
LSNTDSEIHKDTVKEIFLELFNKGYIKKGIEEQAYCDNDNRFIPDRYVLGICPKCGKENVKVGESCEQCNHFITFDEIKNPECKLCGIKPQKRETENFFFDLPQFETKIKSYIENIKNLLKNITDYAV